MIRPAAAWLGLLLALVATAQAQEPARVYRPPRSVADIIGAVGALQGDRAEAERRARLVASEPPAAAGDRELVIFYAQRARAANELGDTARFMSDLRKALELSTPSGIYVPGVDRLWILGQLAFAENYSGSAAEGIRLLQRLVEEAQYPGWKLSALVSLVQHQGASGELAEMEQSMRLSDAFLAEGPRDPRNWALSEWHYKRFNEHARASYHFRFGRYEEAEKAALRAMRASETFIGVAQASRARGNALGPPGFELGLHEWILNELAVFQIALNKLDEAEYHTRKALASKLSRNQGANADLRGSLERLGDIMLNRGRFRDAEAILRETLRVLAEAGVAPTADRLLVTRRKLARSLAAQGRWQEAAALYREVQAQTQAGAMKLVGTIDVAMAHSLLRAGQAAQAVAALAERLDWFARNGLADLPDAVLLRGVQALVLSETGRAAEAEREFEAVIPKLTGRGAPSVLAADATAYTELQKRWIVEGYLDHLRRKAETADPQPRARAVEEALVASDAVRGRGVQLAIHQASLRAAAGTPALAELARKEQDLRNEVGALYAVLNARLSDGGGKPGTIEQQMRQRIADANGELDQIAGRMRKEFSGYANLVAPSLPEVAQVRAALRADEALLALHLAVDRAFVWLVRREGPVAFHSADGRRAIEADIRQLRRALDPNEAGISDRIPEFDMAAAHRLYEKLVKPVESALAGARDLVVIANGDLQQLPLGVLLTTAHPVTPDAAVTFREYRGAPWLAKRFAVAQAPSLNAFLSLRARPPGREGRLEFIGFGDPIFSREQAVAVASSPGNAARGTRPALRNLARTAMLDTAELARLPRLPDTAEEVISISRTLGAVAERDNYLGVRANEREVKRADLANRRIVLFATHGLVPGDLDGLTQPALALTAPEVAGVDGDGLLSMEEVLHLKLDADWVVLSACNTASGDGVGAEAISGLGRAFFYAGARSLLVSSWPVETVSAKLLTTRLFELQSADRGLGRAEALRRSMLHLLEHGEVLRADGKPEYAYAHPLYWAPFSVVGDGR